MDHSFVETVGLKRLTDEQLMNGLETEFTVERRASRNILLYLKEIRSRRLDVKRGFANLFEMLIKHYRQSETSANQRLKALELMLEVPAVEQRLMTGNLNMSTVAMAQRQIRREEKITGQRVSKERKAAIVESITNKTMAQSEVELFKHLPEAASAPQNFERRVSEDATRWNLTVPNEVCEMMTRLKEVWAHVNPSMDNVEVMRRAFKLALEKCDPGFRKAKPSQSKSESESESESQSSATTEKQCATESVKHRSNVRLTYYGKEFDRALWARAGSRCEFVDELTGRRCECTFGLQREHVIPLALGGINELSNMQLLCRPHNLLRARERFGDWKIDQYINREPDPERDRGH